jgi:chemotaxis signal transduction protein
VAHPPKPYLTFRLARTELAVDAAQVRGILPYGELVRVPHARSGLLGVVTVSGRIVNVMDLAAKLRLPPCRPAFQPKIVVLKVPIGSDEHVAGFVADRVCDVVIYAARDLRKGVLHGAGRPRHLIDFSQIVTDRDVNEVWALIP